MYHIIIHNLVHLITLLYIFWCFLSHYYTIIRIDTHYALSSARIKHENTHNKRIAAHTKYFGLYDLTTYISHTALSNRPHERRQTLEQKLANRRTNITPIRKENYETSHLRLHIKPFINKKAVDLKMCYFIS